MKGTEILAGGATTAEILEDEDARSVALNAELPVDPDVRVGTFDNGLRYYIRANDLPENRAELRLVVNAGAVLEGKTVEEVGREVFEEILAVASGRQTKSEAQGIGDEEFVPWTVGPTL